MPSNDPDRLLVVTAAVAMTREDLHRRLLQSVVEVARSMLSAEAATIFVLDPLTNELVFEAVSGTGTRLIGQRISADTGIAGWSWRRDSRS